MIHHNLTKQLIEAFSKTMQGGYKIADLLNFNYNDFDRFNDILHAVINCKPFLSNDLKSSKNLGLDIFNPERFVKTLEYLTYIFNVSTRFHLPDNFELIVDSSMKDAESENVFANFHYLNEHPLPFPVCSFERRDFENEIDYVVLAWDLKTKDLIIKEFQDFVGSPILTDNKNDIHALSDDEDYTAMMLFYRDKRKKGLLVDGWHFAFTPFVFIRSKDQSVEDMIELPYFMNIGSEFLNIQTISYLNSNDNNDFSLEKIDKLLMDNLGMAILECNNIANVYNFLNCSNVEIKTIEANQKLNKSRIKKGKNPLPSYKILSIKGADEKRNYLYVDENDVLNTSFKRSHVRRGHVRRLASGKQTWVRATFVNGSKKGEVAKDYHINM